MSRDREAHSNTMIIFCPICKSKTTWEENPWRPFCSERCKRIDLGKWVSDEYKLEGEETAGDEKERSSDY
jgi:uncharacterized protein